MNKYIYVLAVGLFLSTTVVAQRVLTLENVVELARSQSAASKRADTRKENRYWQYKTYQAGFMPQLALDGTVPAFTQAFRGITQPDGSIIYQSLNQNRGEVELSLSQVVAPTGGRVFVSTSLDRFDDFRNSTVLYGGDPISVGYIQPLFAFNPFKWDKRIEPLRFEESKREYIEEYEQISATASALFFDLLTAQISLQIATLNVQSNDTIYRIAQGRYELGKIPENELLQLELNLMNSRQAVAQAELNLETAQLILRSYLGLSPTETVELVVPASIPSFEVQEQLAIEMAKKNRADAIAFKRRTMEANRDMEEAIKSTGLNADLFGRFGLSNQGAIISDIYNRPDQQVVANVGFNIPIVDWGRQKAIKRTAEANLKLTEFTVQQDSINFEQEVFTQVKTFKMLRMQVDIAQKADEISQKRYEIAKNRYLIGKISITDLSLALTEKDRAKQDYLSSLGNFWEAYYNLRALTLYDFAENKLLYVPETELN